MLPEWERNTPYQRPAQPNYYPDQGNQHYPNQNPYDQPNYQQNQNLAEEQGRVREMRNPRAGYQNQYRSLELPSGRNNPNTSLDYSQMEASPPSYQQNGNPYQINNQYNGMQPNQNSPPRRWFDNVINRSDKKAYGQFLLDQMKLNQGKKALERQKRWEEDQKMLNENNFFDGFGRSREQIIKKYRSGLSQSPLRASTELPAFDKISNRQQHYEFYQRNLPPLQPKDERNRNLMPVNRSFHPDQSINNSLSLLPMDYNDEYNAPRRGDDRSIQQPLRPRENINTDRYSTEQVPQNEPRIIQLRTKERPVRNPENTMEVHQDPHPSAVIPNNAQNLKQFLTKQEYLRALDEQVREKQFLKKTQRELEAMQDKIDNLRLSRERLMKELEAKSMSQERPAQGRTLQPRANNSRRYDEIIYVDDAYTPKPKTEKIEKFQYTTAAEESPKNPKSHVGGGSYTPKPRKTEKITTIHRTIEDEETPKRPIHLKKTPILKNPPSTNNNSPETPVNNSPKTNTKQPNANNSTTKTLETEPEEKTDEADARPDTDKKFPKLKDEAHGFTKNYLEEILSVEDYLKKPIIPKHRDKPKYLRSSDSRESLESETQLVPFNSSNVTSKLNLLNPARTNKPKQTLQSLQPQNYSDKGFYEPKKIEDSWRSPSLQMPIQQFRTLDDKSHVILSTNLTSSLEHYDKRQNLNLVKEYMDPTARIDKLGPQKDESERNFPPSRGRKERYLNSVDRYSIKEPFRERPANRAVKALNRSVDDKFLRSAIATNVTKHLLPETTSDFYEPILQPVEIPKKARLQKRERGIKRKRRPDDVIQP